MIAYILEVCRAAEAFRAAKRELLRQEALSCSDHSEAAARQAREARQQVEAARRLLRELCRS
jgi:hypothetical protein